MFFTPEEDFYSISHFLLFGIIVVLVLPLAFIMRPGKSSFILLQHWAEQHHFQYLENGAEIKIIDRLQSNPGKDFFKARKFFERGTKMSGPYVYTQVGGRNVWLYRIKGLTFEEESRAVRDVHLTDLWCLEVSTHAIPLKVSVAHKVLPKPDVIDVEYIAYEGLYHTDAPFHGITLQLLDPRMIEILTDSEALAVDFSDTSIVVYTRVWPIDIHHFDLLLEQGLKIAEQVDRNFPKTS